MDLRCFVWTVLLPQAAGRNSRPPISMVRRWPDDLQLHANQPIFDLPAALSTSLSRWLAGKRYEGCHALWTSFRAGSSRLLPAGRCCHCIVSRMECMSEPGVALLKG